MGKRSRWALAVLFAAIALAIAIPQTTVLAEPEGSDPGSAVSADPSETPEPPAPAANTAELSVNLVAHRAAAGGAPEQTAAAMDRAVSMRPDHIEVDVQLTEDDVPILVHDSDFARTTNVEKVFPGRQHDPIGSFSYREVRALDAGGWFDADFAGQRVPTLASVADHLYGTGVGLFLELKNPSDSPGLEAAVDEILDADHRWRGIDKTFLSFDASSLHRMDDERPGVRLLWLSPRVPATGTLKAVAKWADELGTDFRNLSKGEVSRAHTAGLPVAAYTVNSEDDQAEAVSLGIDSLITDYPERFLDG